MRLWPVLTILAILSIAAVARADPCKAIPDRGAAPAWLRQGVTISGPVTYVGDGDSLCVGTGPGPAAWVEVRLADFYAPELRAPGGRDAKTALQRLAAGRTVTCRIDHQTYDRVAAVCRMRGRSLGDLLRAAGVREGGNGR